MDRLEQLLRNLRDRCPELELRTEEPMSRHTTFRIGGPAALMALPRTVGEAKAAVRAAACGRRVGSHWPVWPGRPWAGDWPGWSSPTAYRGPWGAV